MILLLLLLRVLLLLSLCLVVQVQNRIDDIAMVFERLHAMMTGQV